MQRTIANNGCTLPQGDFALRAKMALLRKGMSITELAKALGLSRNTVSLAINRGLHRPTQERISEFLSLR